MIRELNNNIYLTGKDNLEILDLSFDNSNLLLISVKGLILIKGSTINRELYNWREEIKEKDNHNTFKIYSYLYDSLFVDFMYRIEELDIFAFIEHFTNKDINYFFSYITNKPNFIYFNGSTFYRKYILEALVRILNTRDNYNNDIVYAIDAQKLTDTMMEMSDEEESN